MAEQWPFLAMMALLTMMTGCASTLPAEALSGAQLTPPTRISRDLAALPEPKGRILVSVYGFRDQTGQYKPYPDSNFSTAVTQGAAPMLIRALLVSNWFIPMERENLQNILTERRIARALEPASGNASAGAENSSMPALRPSSMILEGTIVSYESNVKSGGAGVRYLGVGVSDLYRMDQVTINLRAIDVRNGQVLESISTTKTIYSLQLQTGIFRFVSFKDLLEVEAGYTRNEPAQLCVQEAIETGLIHLIVQGVKKRLWSLKNPADMASPIFRTYARIYDEQRVSQLAEPPPDGVAPALPYNFGG